jgi:hypothetical protein
MDGKMLIKTAGPDDYMLPNCHKRYGNEAKIDIMSLPLGRQSLDRCE